MMKYVYILTFFLCSASCAFAITDDFTIRQRVGVDAAPPSTPTLLSATPISTTQIDLVWSASTDDFELSGYKVFRDAVQVATTTLTSYSDTGLTASTTYAYFVQAFDTIPNVSTSSNTIATTTLQLPATSTPPSDDGNADAPERLKLISLDILPSTNAASIKWKTNQYARFELRWGRTASYELGFVANELFKREHISLISDLEPGTVYEYQLIGYDRLGRQVILSTDRFKTEQLPDDQPPANVTNLRAEVRGNNIVLSWDNPDDSDFSHVRVVRSYFFYPTDPGNGFIAYQGSGESVVDTGAAAAKQNQYYTVYTYDTEGNISSGAVVRVVFTTDAELESTIEPLAITFDDIELLQDGKVVSAEEINGDLPLTIRIAYEKFPEHLKTIVVTLRHPEDNTRTFTFLLRINGDKTYYQALLGALKDIGRYPAVLTVYDHEKSIVQEVHGSLMVWKKDDIAFMGIPLTVGTQDLVERSSWLWLLLLIMLLLYMYHLVHDLFVGKTSAEGVAIARLSALLICTFGIGVAAYMVLGSISLSSVSTTAVLTGANVPPSVVSNLFGACALLGVCCMLLFFIHKRYTATKKK